MSDRSAPAGQRDEVVSHRVIPLRWLLRAACLVAVAILVPAPASARAEAAADPGLGGIGIRLLDVPVETAEDPRARLYIIDHLAPGAVIERRVEVTNTTAAPQNIRMYAAGAAIVDGTFVGDAGDSPNELSSWNTVEPDTLHLDAGGRAGVTVRIAVPDDAAAGERYAVVWAEIRSGTATAGGVEQINRVGIRQYLSIGPGGPPAADFTIDSLTASRSPEDVPLVLARVHNTGGRALDMAGELELFDGPGGLRAGPFPARLGSSLAIGADGHVAILLDEQIPAGPWQAAITLRSGLIERSAQATLTFPRAGSGTAAPATPVDDRWRSPAVAGLLLALLGAALPWAISRRRRDSTPVEDPGADRRPVTAAPPAAPSA